LKSDEKYQNAYWRHKVISFFRNIDLPGFRRVSLLLPKFLLKSTDSTNPHFNFSQDKIWYFIHPSVDHGVERSLYETGFYERGTLDFIKANLGEGDTYMDIGGNIGVHALIAAKVVGEKGSVWAFEPHHQTMSILEKNIAENDFQNIHAFQCGIGAEKSQAVLYDNWSINKGASSTVIKAEKSLAIEIEILPLDMIVQQYSLRPKMLKMDVEGMELEVLKGASRTIEAYKPILIVEFSEDRAELPEGRKNLFDYIQNLNAYELFKQKGGKERTGKLQKISNFGELPIDDNVYCLPIKNQ
jgi:FkbM family methyltransferase